MSTDREQKIADIRKAYAEETKWAGDPDDVLYLLTELDLLQQENTNLRMGTNVTVEDVIGAIEETMKPSRKQLEEERDRLIEGLQWYATLKVYEQEKVPFDEENQLDYYYDKPEVLEDEGAKARTILKELGYETTQEHRWSKVDA